MKRLYTTPNTERYDIRIERTILSGAQYGLKNAPGQGFDETNMHDEGTF